MEDDEVEIATTPANEDTFTRVSDGIMRQVNTKPPLGPLQSAQQDEIRL